MNRVQDLPNNERSITDDAFFRAMDLSRRGLADVRKAYEKDNLDDARRAVVRYFHRRQRPRFISDYRGASQRQVLSKMVPYWMDGVEELLRRADALLENRIIGHSGNEVDLGPELDMQMPELQVHSSMAGFFKEMSYLSWLGTAFLITGQTSYICKYCEILSRFLCEWPLVWVHRGSSYTLIQEQPAQSILNVSKRVNLWLSLLYTDIPYGPHVPYDLTFRMIRSMWFAITQFRRLASDDLVLNNRHIVTRGISPFRFAVLLPEFPLLQPLLAQGRQYARRAVEEAISDDGGYVEHSTGYTAGPGLGPFATGERLARLNGTYFFTKAHRNRLRRAYETMASLIMPNGYLPDIGDGHGPYCDDFLKTGHDVFGSKVCDAVMRSLKIVRGRRPAGEHLPPLSVRYDDAGYIAGRDGWIGSSNYFIMSTNTRGGIPGHDHQDMLSVLLSVKGQPMIGEPARHLYGVVKIDPELRGHLYNMTSHNTVLAYGKPIRDDIFFGHRGGGYAVPAKILDFEEGKGWMYAKAAHDGYACSRHQREILFVHRKGWLFLDQIVTGPEGAPPHVQRWHFEREVDVQRVDTHAILAVRGKARLLCIWPKRKDVRIRLRRNSKLNVGTFAKARRGPWMVDVSFRGTGNRSQRYELPCAFVVQGLKIPPVLPNKLRKGALQLMELDREINIAKCAKLLR